MKWQHYFTEQCTRLRTKCGERYLAAGIFLLLCKWTKWNQCVKIKVLDKAIIITKHPFHLILLLDQSSSRVLWFGVHAYVCMLILVAKQLIYQPRIFKRDAYFSNFDHFYIGWFHIIGTQHGCIIILMPKTKENSQ